MVEGEIREARDEDSAAIIDLIGGIFDEYPGMVLDVDLEMPHLRHPATAFRRWDGRLWVAEREGRVVACGGYTAEGDAAELKHLYVAQRARRQGLARDLCELIEREARERGFQLVELWTDTRFLDAHRLYQRLGYEQLPTERALHDLSDSVEYAFRKDLRRETGRAG